MKTQGNQKLNKNNFKKYLQKKRKKEISSLAMTALTSKDDFKQRNKKTPLLPYLSSCNGSVLT